MSLSEGLQACVVCAHPLVGFDSFQDQGIELRYDLCRWCGLVQMNPRPDEAELARHYEETYWDGIGDEDRSATTPVQRRRARQQRDLAGARPTRHLDVGCSMGALLGEFGAAHQVGVEPGRAHRALAAEAGIEVHQSLGELAAGEPDPFDLITMSHVLEHLRDPVTELRQLGGLLAPDGELLIEVPSLYRSRAYELAHLLAFDERSLAATLRHAGFEIVRRRTHRGRQGSLGTGRNLAVVAVTARPRPPVDQRRRRRAMLARRWLGFAPQQWYRWRNRTYRRVRRRLGTGASDGPTAPDRTPQDR